MKALKSPQSKQQGIVLLSCLVLLILILSLLRFMMSTSYLSERRSSVDSEMFTANEQALNALKIAEDALLCINADGTRITGKCDSNQAETRKGANEFWRSWLVDSSKPLPSELKNSFVRGKDVNRSGDCRHIWKCTNWLTGGSKVNTSNTYTPMNVVDPNNPSFTHGQFIVEVFPGEALGLDEKSDNKDNIRNVIFRVTAMGFGQVRSGNTVEMTNHLVQADYVFSKEEE
ncbi:MAG: hypothetical protein Q4B71_07360 [Cardiobacteriaceae bacterium]|nr:hypothetical protein [Cardiobacteriaceae bacterium]